MEGCALECLSTSTLLPSAETGTLWEQACSGVFYVQCMQGESRAKSARNMKHKGSATLFTPRQVNRHFLSVILLF